MSWLEKNQRFEYQMKYKKNSPKFKRLTMHPLWMDPLNIVSLRHFFLCLWNQLQLKGNYSIKFSVLLLVSLCMCVCLCFACYWFWQWSNDYALFFQIKCENYLPEDHSSCMFGDIEVRVEKVKTKQGYTVRHLTLRVSL